MAPLPSGVQILTHQAVVYVSGYETALSWKTVLAVAAVIAAAMQGTLGMESANPCRLSNMKYKLLLFLEAVEVVIVVVSETVSFVELRNVLKERLKWLQWLPPCLLTIGLLQLVADLWWTCHLATVSRLQWIPLSLVGWQKQWRSSLFSTPAKVVPFVSQQCSHSF